MTSEIWTTACTSAPLGRPPGVVYHASAGGTTHDAMAAPSRQPASTRISVVFMRASSPNSRMKPRTIAARLPLRVLRDLQHLTGLDLVGIAQLILIRVEDVHVGVGVAQMLLGDLAE